jgi:hypothetical protein
MWHFSELRFVDSIFFVICGINTAESPQIHSFSPYKCHIQCSISDLYKIKNLLRKRLLELFWDRAVKYFVEIGEFFICGLIIKICGFANCGQARLRNLRIRDCGLSPRICGFATC